MSLTESVRKFFRSRTRQEARDAVANADQLIADAKSREPEIRYVTERIHAHGRENHFGERIYQAAIRRA